MQATQSGLGGFVTGVFLPATVKHWYELKKETAKPILEMLRHLEELAGFATDLLGTRRSIQGMEGRLAEALSELNTLRASLLRFDPLAEALQQLIWPCERAFWFRRMEERATTCALQGTPTGQQYLEDLDRIPLLFKALCREVSGTRWRAWWRR